MPPRPPPHRFPLPDPEDGGEPIAPTAAAPETSASEMPAPESEPPSPSLEALAAMDGDAFTALMDKVSARARDHEVGDDVEGVVVRLDGDLAWVDLGGKAEASIAVADLQPEEAVPGATIRARLLAEREDGLVLARLVRPSGDRALLAAACEARLPVLGHVESRNAGGYVVSLGGIHGFCPVSQIDRFPGRDLDRFVGQSFPFLVTDPGDREVLLSRRALQDAEVQRNRERFWSGVRPGDLLEGVVTSVREYGAFVDLGGVEGLVHRSEMSWEAVEDPARILSRWDTVRVKVLEMDRKRRRVALSLRLPETGPWSRVGTDFVEDGVYEGRVTRLADFGAFVEIAPGLTGLVRTPNLSWDRVETPADAVQPGQQVTVRVLEVDQKRQRLDLGIRQATEDPLQAMVERYPVGGEVTGVVQQVAAAGVVLLVDEAVPAWLPGREVSLPPGVLLQQRVRKGARITARVVEMDRRNRRLRLSQTASSEADDEQTRKDLARRTGGGTFGTFADLLGKVKID
ncbi:MAG: 30S ribosomal protein S1 [Deltaproteobacteria bacterium]|nr:30S ribosomal protein S1 [Deltaproteobacteria bacterium]